MIKVLYIAVGICLTRTMDEIRKLSDEYVDFLKERREKFATFIPLPAIQKGSQADIELRARTMHMQSAEPEVRKITQRIRRIRMIPLAIYACATLGLLILIGYLESKGVSA